MQVIRGLNSPHFLIELTVGLESPNYLLYVAVAKDTLPSLYFKHALVTHHLAILVYSRNRPGSGICKRRGWECYKLDRSPPLPLKSIQIISTI